MTSNVFHFTRFSVKDVVEVIVLILKSTYMVIKIVLQSGGNNAGGVHHRNFKDISESSPRRVPMAQDSILSIYALGCCCWFPCSRMPIEAYDKNRQRS
jgi:hypothetical protein